MQLNHPGRQAPRFNRETPVAPSAVPMRGAFGMFRTPRPLSDREIKLIITRFAVSARLAQAAGFGGVQIHGAHGYLVSQFLSPFTNRREDGWGGTPDKRRRFLISLVRAIRSAVGSRFPIAVKLNSADFQRGGFDESESMAVVEALEAEGIDLLEISGGTYESAVMFAEAAPRHQSTRQREAFFLDYAEKVRKRTRLPLMVTGGFRSLIGMEDALASGDVDLIGVARPLAAEPDLPSRLIAGTSERARSIDLSTGIKKLDALLQGAFYGEQIRRMSEGLDPDPELGKLHVLSRYLAPPRIAERARSLQSQYTSVGVVPVGKSLQHTLS
jgi:2,4-dienoyl-CoA reductase-like NADH-dependent reductase (Old Yellow Enzyme family)